jgi:hypothetical protein
MKRPLNIVAGVIGLFACFAVHAGTFASKDWIWSTNGNDYYYAATLNSAERVLGQYCYLHSGICLYIVDIGITCNKGHKYPALINSNTGSAFVTLICGNKFREHNVLAISKFDDIDRIVRHATRLGVAIGMQNGLFKVTRFNLAGSAYAIGSMRQAVQEKVTSGLKNSGIPVEQVL